MFFSVFCKQDRNQVSQFRFLFLTLLAMKAKVLITLTICALAFTMKAQRNTPFSSSIRTLRTFVAERPTAPPIIELSSGEHIAVEFDYLSHEYHRFLYRIEHCDADWNVSEDLFESDYLSGNNGEEPIDQETQSLNTMQQYTHYALRLPNERIGITLAGNYKLTLIDDTEGEPQPVAQAFFTVVNPKVTISATASTDTEIDRNDSHQQLTVRLNFNQLNVREPRKELSIVVLQNRRYDNAVIRPNATAVAPSALLWEHSRELIFPAGNEYRKFELLSTRRGNFGVDNIRWFDPYYHATLFVDEPRRNYLYDEDQDGLSVIRTTDGADSDTEADYVFVHFALNTPRRDDGDYYLNGNWTDDRLDAQWRMTYDEASGCYTAAPLLKLGYYSYQYLFVPHEQPGTGFTAPAEGDYYQTENEYTIIAYYRAQGARYEEPVGTLTFKFKPQ